MPAKQKLILTVLYLIVTLFGSPVVYSWNLNPTSADYWDENHAAHLASRAGFGLLPVEIAGLAAQEPKKAVAYFVDGAGKSNVSAKSSARRIRKAWSDHETNVDYGIVPMDLPKFASCVDAGLATQLCHASFRNNAFDTHVQQPDLHRRLLSCADDAIFCFVKDLQRLGHADRVLVMVYSEFGRRVPENANLGTDHGSANNMFFIGNRVNGGHYCVLPSLVNLIDSGNLAFTTEFRQVHATAIEDWLKVDIKKVLKGAFERFPISA